LKAAVCTTYGAPDVVKIKDVPQPAIGASDVLIRAHATTVSSGDARLRGARFPAGFAVPARLMFGVSRPRKAVLGTELSGVIERVGGRVTQFRAGDRVIAFPGMRLGGHAEYISMPEQGAIVPMPSSMAFDEAAALAFGGTTALYFMRDRAQIKAGDRVLIHGASGAVGIAAAQLARHAGCHVTAVCSAANGALMQSLGANEVIDYRAQDFKASGEQWDVILDTVGTLNYAACARSMSANGRLLLIAAGLREMLPSRQARRDGKTVITGGAPERREDLAHLVEFAASGRYRSIIDSRFPLDDIVRAHARVDSARKVGSVVVTVHDGT
jgi:NADPH:quinone reductase-like Zn-dependent oxidoreductase